MNTHLPINIFALLPVEVHVSIFFLMIIKHKISYYIIARVNKSIGLFRRVMESSSKLVLET